MTTTEFSSNIIIKVICRSFHNIVRADQNGRDRHTQQQGHYLGQVLVHLLRHREAEAEQRFGQKGGNRTDSSIGHSVARQLISINLYPDQTVYS